MMTAYELQVQLQPQRYQDETSSDTLQILSNPQYLPQAPSPTSLLLSDLLQVEGQGDVSMAHNQLD